MPESTNYLDACNFAGNFERRERMEEMDSTEQQRTSSHIWQESPPSALWSSGAQSILLQGMVRYITVWAGRL